MDLKFSIIAQIQEAGWNKAKGAIDGLKSAFNSMKGGGVAAWRAIAAGAATAIGAIISVGAAAHKIYTSMRDSYLDNLEQMEQGNLKFFQGVQTWQRKLEFADTKKTKARLVEDTRQELQDLELKKKQLVRRDGMDTRFEGAGENLQAMLDEKMFGGNGLTRDEMELRLIEMKIKKTKEFLGLAQSKDVSKFGQSDISAATGDLSKQRDAQAAEIAGNAIDQAVEASVKAVQEAAAKMEAATANYAANIGDDEAAKAVIDATKVLQDAEAKRHEAWKAQAEERGRISKEAFDREAANSEGIGGKQDSIRSLGEGVAKSARDFAYSQATPADQIRMDQERMLELGKQYNARDGLGQFAASPEERAGMIREGYDIKGRMASAEKEAKATIEAEKKAKEEARKANAGRSLSAGDLFTNLYGQNIQKTPEREQADSLKEAVEVLKAIEKKTGASA